MRHQHISFVKSGLRILGFGMILTILPYGNPDTVLPLFFGGIALQIVAEIIGIVEEIGHE